ncbi:uncharacterized protein LOC110461752 [Mizuhopecten yessoensis]|uniref:uncharacterized protein LOC110461752 n=1 Tax=Mizuhopecten yessoensis TaxID=6573 RepID=UPI000B45D34F|nr:uncharacterized protein LOC110461752 [Mizuhopecten yessoensis]
MVHTCAIHGCRNRANGEIKRGFYTIPSIRIHEGTQTEELSKQIRTAWLARINRKDFSPTTHTKVCSDHFVSGKPGSLYDTTNPDWAPSLRLTGEDKGNTDETSYRNVGSTRRYERAHARKAQKEKSIVAEALLELSHFDVRAQDYYSDNEEIEVKRKNCLFYLCGTLEDQHPHAQVNEAQCTADDTDFPSTKPIDETLFKQVSDECQRLTTENISLRDKVQEAKISEDSFKDDKKVNYYTGLPGFLTLMSLFEFLMSDIPDGNRSSLTKFQKLILVLMRLRLNLPVQDLAYRFDVSQATISRAFLSVIHVMFIKLKDFIYWPQRNN